ncbi:unnamed protein product, partial [Phaeothamnion confervicola]
SASAASAASRLVILSLSAAAAAPAALGYEYIGCYRDDPMNRDMAMDGDAFFGTLTPAVCEKFCEDFQYFGLQYSRDCFCSNHYGGARRSFASSSDCNMPCDGDHSIMCGGIGINSVYKVGDGSNNGGGGDTPTPKPPTPTPPGPTPAAPQPTGPIPTPEATGIPRKTPDYQYVGCFKDDAAKPDLEGESHQYETLSRGRCARICHDYKFFGLQGSDTCYCGNSIGKVSSLGDSEMCNMPCKGHSGQTCGGADSNSVFKLTDNAGVPSPTPPGTLPTPMPTPAPTPAAVIPAPRPTAGGMSPTPRPPVSAPVPIPGQTGCAAARSFDMTWAQSNGASGILSAPGKRVLLNSAVKITSLLVAKSTTLVLGDGAELTVKCLSVNGRLESGTETCAFEGSAQVILDGSLTGALDPSCEADTDFFPVLLINEGGQLEMVGRKGFGRAWTTLTEPAARGSKMLRFNDNVSTAGWQPGDQVLVVTSDYDPTFNEVHTIASVTPTSVTLRDGLKYYHHGSSLTDPFDVERAEVGLLSRNVVISAASKAFGGHTKAVKGFDMVKYIGVEMDGLGMAQLGTYPVHFHECDDIRDYGAT